MARAVKKTISLPPDLVRIAEGIAREEGKTLSDVVQEALMLLRKQKLRKKFKSIQDYWSRKAREKWILTEEDLERYLKN